MAAHMETEMELLRLGAAVAAQQIAVGMPGPRSVGSCTYEVYERLCDQVSPACRLQWRQGSDGLQGDVFNYGDSSGPHQSVIATLSSSISQDCVAYRYRPSASGALTTRLNVPTGTALTGPTFLRGKEPDLSWLYPERASVRTALEVVFRNETDHAFEEELEEWALSGTNAIGVKVIKPSWITSLSDIRTSASIVIVVQEAGSRIKRVWRHGPLSHDISFSRGLTLEQPGSLAALPIAWLGPHSRWLPASSSEDEQFILSGHELVQGLIFLDGKSTEADEADYDETLKRLCRELGSTIRAEIMASPDLTLDAKRRLLEARFL